MLYRGLGFDSSRLRLSVFLDFFSKVVRFNTWSGFIFLSTTGLFEDIIS
jgi:hypothetical protein